MPLTLISAAGGSTARSKKSTDIIAVEIDFSAWVSSLPKALTTTVETLGSVNWSADSGMAINGNSLTGNKAWAQLQGGIAGSTATITAVAITSENNSETVSYTCKIE